MAQPLWLVQWVVSGMFVLFHRAKTEPNNEGLDELRGRGGERDDPGGGGRSRQVESFLKRRICRVRSVGFEHVVPEVCIY